MCFGLKVVPPQNLGHRKGEDLLQILSFPGRKVHTYTFANSVITNLLSILRILVDNLCRVHAKGGKALMISNLAVLLVVFRVTARQASLQ